MRAGAAQDRCERPGARRRARAVRCFRDPGERAAARERGGPELEVREILLRTGSRRRDVRRRRRWRRPVGPAGAGLLRRRLAARNGGDVHRSVARLPRRVQVRALPLVPGRARRGGVRARGRGQPTPPGRRAAEHGRPGAGRRPAAHQDADRHPCRSPDHERCDREPHDMPAAPAPGTLEQQGDGKAVRRPRTLDPLPCRLWRSGGHAPETRRGSTLIPRTSRTASAQFWRVPPRACLAAWRSRANLVAELLGRGRASSRADIISGSSARMRPSCAASHSHSRLHFTVASGVDMSCAGVPAFVAAAASGSAASRSCSLAASFSTTPTSPRRTRIEALL